MIHIFFFSVGKRPKASDSGRRETSGIKYVETSVVADSTMFDYHGGDTEFYIFTLLNQVNRTLIKRKTERPLFLFIFSLPAACRSILSAICKVQTKNVLLKYPTLHYRRHHNESLLSSNIVLLDLLTFISMIIYRFGR